MLVATHLNDVNKKVCNVNHTRFKETNDMTMGEGHYVHYVRNFFFLFRISRVGSERISPTGHFYSLDMAPSCGATQSWKNLPAPPPLLGNIFDGRGKEVYAVLSHFTFFQEINTHTCLPSTSLPDWKHGKIAFQHFQKCTLQIFVIAMHLTVLLPSLINRGYTQVYEIIFTQHPPNIGTL